MAYNKAREEKKWRLWKAAEEKELRRLGINERIIEQLRKADWENFKAERRFFEHILDTDTYRDWQATDDTGVDIHTAQDLLDNIDSGELHRILSSADKLTLQIVLLMMDGYMVREIATKLSLTDKAVYRRIDRLKEKIKNIL